jgi:hypothetical protein
MDRPITAGMTTTNTSMNIAVTPGMTTAGIHMAITATAWSGRT